MPSGEDIHNGSRGGYSENMFRTCASEWSSVWFLVDKRRLVMHIMLTPYGHSSIIWQLSWVILNSLGMALAIVGDFLEKLTIGTRALELRSNGPWRLLGATKSF